MSDGKDITFRMDKLKALVHYVCRRALGSDPFDKTRLNKILFYSDTEAYLALGGPITGEVYVKHQYGPVASHFDEVIEELEAEKALAVVEPSGVHAYSGEPHARQHYVALRKPTLQDFSADEISIVDECIQVVCRKDAAQPISDHAHDLAWKSAHIGEELPYFTVFSRLIGEVTPSDTKWAGNQLKRRA